MLKKSKGGSGFGMVPNELTRKASIKATGMWCFIEQLPEGWDFSVEGLSKVMHEGKDAIRSAVQELENLGYLVRVQGKNDIGKFSKSDWELRWHPENPSSEEPSAENPTTENPPQYHIERITNRTNGITKDKDICKSNKKKSSYSSKEVKEIAERVKEFWNKVFGGTNKVPNIRGITDFRLKKVRDRLDNGFTPEDFVEAILNARESDFCMNKFTGFGFDWLFDNDKNMMKLVENTFSTKAEIKEDPTGTKILAAAYQDDKMRRWLNGEDEPKKHEPTSIEELAEQAYKRLKENN